MTNKSVFKAKTPAADFEILASRFYTITREMGLSMERTARSPVYFAAHDFTSAILTLEAELISMAEYIAILVGATPFVVKAVTQYFGDDIAPGDVFLVNDPYTNDGGNHLADWSIVYPVFYRGKLKYFIGQKAHQQDTGGGVPGGYNPNAIDVYAEGLRIPPVKIFDRGRERKDVLNLILTNVRIYDTQRADLLSLIGASKVGARRLEEVLERYGDEKISTFISDLLNYSESRMRQAIDNIPEATYRGETSGIESSSPIVAEVTVKGSDMVIDLSRSGPQTKNYVNSPIANTYSAMCVALLGSLGKKIEARYRNSGLFRPVKLITTPGTIVHAKPPATVGNSTVCIGKQIIEVIWDALSQALPEEISGGWGSPGVWTYSGIDPRRNERFSGPDFLGGTGAGAIWGTDGWNCSSSPISSGTLWRPEIEIVESRYPIFSERWELLRDSGGPGKWRGGLAMENIWSVDAGSEPIFIASNADPYAYRPVPLVRGGKRPPDETHAIEFADGKKESNEDTRRKKAYVLHTGDRIIDLCWGGCGVGDPLERDVEAVKQDVKNGYISLKSALEDYGVALDPKTLEIDHDYTRGRRKEKPDRHRKTN